MSNVTASNCFTAKHANVTLPLAASQVLQIVNGQVQQEAKTEIKKIQNELFPEGIVFFVPFRSPQLDKEEPIPTENGSKRTFRAKKSSNSANSLSQFNQDTLVEMQQIITFSQGGLHCLNYPLWKSVLTPQPSPEHHSFQAMENRIGLWADLRIFPRKHWLFFTIQDMEMTMKGPCVSMEQARIPTRRI
jgi:hypothetical protein